MDQAAPPSETGAETSGAPPHHRTASLVDLLTRQDVTLHDILEPVSGHALDVVVSHAYRDGPHLGTYKSTTTTTVTRLYRDGPHLNEENVDPKNPKNSYRTKTNNKKNDSDSSSEEEVNTVEKYRSIQRRRRRLRPNGVKDLDEEEERKQNRRQVKELSKNSMNLMRTASRPAETPRGEIHYGYHDYILDSNLQWGHYMHHLTSIDRFNENYRCERRVFAAWKRVCWWRVLRVRYGKRCLSSWRALAVNTIQFKRSAEIGQRFFSTTGLNRGWKAFVNSAKRRQLTKRKKMTKTADSQFSESGSKRAMKQWKEWRTARKEIREGAKKLGKLNFELTMSPVISSLKESAVKAINSGYLKVAIRKLMRNVDERRRLRSLYYMAWDKSEIQAMKRGLMKFRRYASQKKDFRVRLLLAFSGNEKLLMSRMYFYWRVYWEEVLETRQAVFDNAERALKLRTKRIYLEKLFKNRVQGLAIKEADIMFEDWKIRRSIRQWRLFVVHKSAIRAFGHIQAFKSETRLKIMCFQAWKSRITVLARGRVVKYAIHHKLAKKTWRKMSIVYGAASFCKLRIGLTLAKIMVAWLSFSLEEKQRRLKLVRLAMVFYRRRILRTVKLQARAKNFFAIRCTWSCKLLAFREVKKFGVRQKQGRRLMIKQYSHMLRRKTELAMQTWKFVVERCSWQEARLRLGVARSKRKTFDLWKDWATEERSDRLLLEFAARQDDKFRQRRFLKKLRREGIRRKREKTGILIAKKHYFRQWVTTGLSHWQANTLAWKEGKDKTAIGVGFYRENGLRSGFNFLLAYRKAWKVKRLMRVAALMLRKKHGLGRCLLEWRKVAKKSIVLRLGLQCGLRLMVILAWKRWRAGALLVRHRKKWLRVIVGGWRKEARWQGELCERGLFRRFWKRWELGTKEQLGRKRVEGGMSAAGILWRDALRRYKLLRINDGRIDLCVWAGSIRLQSLHIAMGGLKTWLLGKLERARSNVVALQFWKDTLCRRVFVEWKGIKAERIFLEINNEVALDFWYRSTIKCFFRAWEIRTMYFVKIRLEAEAAQLRAGFEKFVGGIDDLKLKRLQRLAASELSEMRLRRVLGSHFTAWSDYVLFERKDRELRRQRKEILALQREVLIKWRMWVRGLKLTRLVHVHHDKRFNASMEHDIMDELRASAGGGI
ncbi:hypothetical protein TL16_g11658 [Triparma laevis f. inornata]|uniref:Sfi1 spindle body domain-containing protein n=1 Tax=Triparma laevis f. inornata TaxID=1714386 RepID=A0A9W7ESK3_9STRA|nr:hypothetical protein TL16_g11658 [Triparma laevis f. inornata]